MVKLECINKDKNIKVIIQEDSCVGFYLYVIDTLSNKCLKDSLQDTLEVAIEEAEELYGIKKEDWIKIS